MLGRSLRCLAPWLAVLGACHEQAPPATNAEAAADNRAPAPASESRASGAAAPAATIAAAPSGPPSAVLAPACARADWEVRLLPPPLAAAKRPQRGEPDQLGAAQLLFDAECSDSPNGPRSSGADVVTVDGVNVRLTSVKPAGSTGRGWSGNQCSFELRAADGSGQPVVLGPELVPPFNSVTALVRSGSAVWLSVGFNGYAREFPAGGNRVLAADLCRGTVTWHSSNATSNGGLLLLGDYLISPYGFTSEPRFLHVFDTHTGSMVQKLPIVENVCPSESWRPHWHPGERCDAPGQKVGAATNPRVSGNLLFVDTNTGSSTFALR